MSNDSQLNANDEIVDLDTELNNAQGQAAKQEVVDAAKIAVETKSPYAGKSQEELAKMLEDAQSHIQSQANEVGNTRALLDDMIKANLAPKPEGVANPAADESVDDLDILTNPKEYIAKQVASNPEVVAAREANITNAQKAAQDRVAAAHADSADLVGTAEFQDYLKESPYRQKMFSEAVQNFDADAGIELLNNFKSQRSTASAAATTEIKEGAEQKLKDGVTPTAGSTTGSTPKRKVYRREDLRKLLRNDPKRYSQLQPEIMAAYREKRVI